jgi:hypothetical protein
VAEPGSLNEARAEPDVPALVAEDQLHSPANAGKANGQVVERVEHRILPSQEDHTLEHHVVQPDCCGQTLAVLGETQGSGREALFEQGDELGTDEGAKNVLPSRDVGPRDGGDLGRDTVEESGVAVLITGLRAEARRHPFVGGCGLEGTEVPGHRRLGDAETRDQPKDLGVLGVVERQPRSLVGREIDGRLVPLQRLGEYHEAVVSGEHESVSPVLPYLLSRIQFPGSSPRDAGPTGRVPGGDAARACGRRAQSRGCVCRS